MCRHTSSLCGPPHDRRVATRNTWRQEPWRLSDAPASGWDHQHASLFPYSGQDGWILRARRGQLATFHDYVLGGHHFAISINLFSFLYSWSRWELRPSLPLLGSMVIGGGGMKPCWKNNMASSISKTGRGWMATLPHKNNSISTSGDSRGDAKGAHTCQVGPCINLRRALEHPDSLG